MTPTPSLVRCYLDREPRLPLPPPSMSTRHGRRSSDDAYYHAVPQSPLAPNPIALSASLAGSSVLDPENEEDVIEETVLVETKVTPAIRGVCFVFGCAVLLPWNGMSSQSGHSVTTMAYIVFLPTAMITATPYFLAQLEGSSLQRVFPSYFSLISTTSNFGFLAYATATSKRVCRGQCISLRG